MKYDSGFAPNPFYNVCTLATCKPGIRKKAKIGDWVIGTGSKKYQEEKKLVYVMRVTEILSLEEYFDDPRFTRKKPRLYGSRKQAGGDNIYTKVNGKWKQLNSYHSDKGGFPNIRHIKRDTKVNRMLISDNYIYYGANGPLIPNSLRQESRNIIKEGPNCKKFFTPRDEEMIKEFENWIRSSEETGYVSEPRDWR